MTLPLRRLPALFVLSAGLALGGMLCAGGAGAQTRASDPNDALFQAARTGDLPAAQASLAAGASVEARDSAGLTAADIAVDKGHFKVAHFLLSVRNQSHLSAPKQQPVLAPPPVPSAVPAQGQAPSAAPAAVPRPAAPEPPRLKGPNPFDPSVPLGTGMPGFQAGPAPAAVPVSPPRQAMTAPAPTREPKAAEPAAHAVAAQLAPDPVSDQPPLHAAVAAGGPPEKPSPSFMQRLLQTLSFSNPAPAPAPAAAVTEPVSSAAEPAVKAASSPAPAEQVAQAAPPPPAPAVQTAPAPAQPAPVVTSAPKPAQPEPPAQAAPTPAQTEKVTQAAPAPRPAPAAQAAKQTPPAQAAKQTPAAQAIPQAPVVSAVQAPPLQVAQAAPPTPAAPPPAEGQDALGRFFSKMASFFVSGDPKKLAPSAEQPAAEQKEPAATQAQPAPAQANTVARVVARQLAVGVEGKLGRNPPPTGFGVKLPCIEKLRSSVLICVEDVTWPSEMKAHFAVESVLYKGYKIITRYNDGRAAFVHTLFPSGSFAAVVGHFTRLYGEPSETWTRTIAPLGEPRRGNPVMVWFGYDNAAKQPVYLEVRQFDDARADFPDTERGAVLLHYDDATPIFPLVSKIELMRIRN